MSEVSALAGRAALSARVDISTLHAEGHFNLVATPLPDPSGSSLDPLTEVLRSGARRLIEQAVEAELTALLAAHAGEATGDG